MLRHYCPERWMDSLPASCSQDWGPLCRETDTAPGGQRMRGYKQEAQWRWTFVKRRNIFSHAGTACNPLVRGTCKPLINNLLILLSPAVRKSIGFLWLWRGPRKDCTVSSGAHAESLFSFTRSTFYQVFCTLYQPDWSYALLWARVSMGPTMKKE